jgi:hypothetical protein
VKASSSSVAERSRPTRERDALQQQVKAYSRARALSEPDPRAAVSVLRALLQRWPHSDLEPEVRFLLVLTLDRLGDEAARARELAVFARRYPATPYLARLKKRATQTKNE